jgi:hypothetical protein
LLDIHFNLFFQSIDWGKLRLNIYERSEHNGVELRPVDTYHILLLDKFGSNGFGNKAADAGMRSSFEKSYDKIRNLQRVQLIKLVFIFLVGIVDLSCKKTLVICNSIFFTFLNQIEAQRDQKIIVWVEYFPYKYSFKVISND